MNDKKWKRFLQQEMDKELQEIEGILEEMNNDPNMKDIVAPEEMHENLFAQIREEEAKSARLTDEEKELIRLGRVYKKTRKWNKYLVLVAAVVCALLIGVTSLGGPKRVIEKVSWMISGRDQTSIDEENERLEKTNVISEAEAYQQIEEEFGFFPVRLDYLPEGMEFEDIGLTENAQNVYLSYVGENEETIIYSIYLNYRTGSTGRDVEDTLIEEYDKLVGSTTINVKKYQIEENQSIRYKISYEYQDVYYFLEINNVENEEVEKIVENLYFN